MLEVAIERIASLVAEAKAAALVLSDAEQERMTAYRMPALRARFLAGRWLARRLLCESLSGDASDWCLTAAAGAPPAVLGRPDLFLSISHSGDWLACALSNAPVGVDIEQLNRDRDVTELAAVVAHESERQRLLVLTDVEQQRYFAQLWTLKEAWLKSQGLGLDFRLMRELTAQRVVADLNAANAVTWFDQGAKLTLALVSAYVSAGAAGRPARWLAARDPADMEYRLLVLSPPGLLQGSRDSSLPSDDANQMPVALRT